MSKISIVDDDAALDLLADNLRFLGHDVRRFKSMTSALKSMDYISSSHLTILDIYLDMPVSHTRKLASGVRTAGLAVYSKIRSINQQMPILVYSACQEKDTIDVIRKDALCRFLPKSAAPSMKDIIKMIDSKLGIQDVLPRPQVFIVHGHNDALKYELKNYLQNSLHLPEPIVLHEQPNMGRTVMEKFEDYGYGSNLAFVLLTRDDIGARAGHKDETKRRARQNVILELGFFLGALGRGRVVLLYAGPLELPSDLSGVSYIDISNGVQAAGEEIRRELENVSQQPW